MKHLMPVFILLVLVINTYGQSPTTVEEYNYMTKGYRIQVESGLDMKKGYEFKDYIDKNKIGDYTFTMKGLIRTKNNEVAGILVIAYSHISKKTYYIGIPQNNNELANAYVSQFDNWDINITRAYTFLTSLSLANSLAKNAK